MVKKYKYCFFILVIAIISVGCASYVVYGYSRVDHQREASLTVSFQPEGFEHAGMRFCLYHVADISDTAKFILSEQFQGTTVSFQNLNQEEWKQLAQQLSNYIQKVRSKIEPLAVQKTNDDGETTFAKLQTGLYLVVGEVWEGENTIISPVPFLVSLPSRNQEQEWQYDMNAVVKYTLHTEPEPLPSTGDKGNIVLLLVLACSGIVFCFLCFVRKKHDM